MLPKELVLKISASLTIDARRRFAEALNCNPNVFIHALPPKHTLEALLARSLSLKNVWVSKEDHQTFIVRVEFSENHSLYTTLTRPWEEALITSVTCGECLFRREFWPNSEPFPHWDFSWRSMNLCVYSQINQSSLQLRMAQFD